MAIRGIERVRRNLKLKVSEISTTRSAAAVRMVLSQGAALSDLMTPIDTSNLINSRYAPEIQIEANRVMGDVGYSALYAGAVHDAPGTNVGRNTPRDPDDPSRGNMWDPNAEPQFLSKGFEQLTPSIPAILKAVYGGRGTA